MKSQKPLQAAKAQEKVKPTVLAVNKPRGGFAAGCPARDSYMCSSCFRK